MENKMKTYLGEQYTENHPHNFIRYWLKASEGNGDAWRKKNDLDCLYFDGDLRADTLMSAWTPVKWVADFLNREYGKKFYKKRKNAEDPQHDLKLLLEDTGAYLPPKHELVQLLNEFLELAEQRCNYILLPDRRMNPDRYRMEKPNGETLCFFDEVPALLYNIFMRDTLGKYFADFNDAVRWVEREHLEMGFTEETIAPMYVRPLVPGLNPGEAKWLTEEREIAKALKYMIRFLKERKALLEETEPWNEISASAGMNEAEVCSAGRTPEELVCDVIRFLQKWGLWQDVSILVNGKRYFDDMAAPIDTVFPNLEHVRVEMCEDVEEYTRGLTGYRDCEGDWKTKWISFANPQHIFDMVYEGPLSVLLYQREYETKRSAVSDEAWEEIFRKTDLLDRYLQENCEVCSPEELLALMTSGEITDLKDMTVLEEIITMGEVCASKTCAWDPLVFDTWEEYREVMGWEDSGSLPRYQSFDTYEEYQKFLDKEWTTEDVMPVWEKFLDKVKTEVRTEKELLYCPEMTGRIISEFDRIFERYGLWYDLGFSWSLSCYNQ